MPHLGSAVEFQALQLGVSGAAGPSKGASSAEAGREWWLPLSVVGESSALAREMGLFQLSGYALPL